MSEATCPVEKEPPCSAMRLIAASIIASLLFAIVESTPSADKKQRCPGTHFLRGGDCARNYPLNIRNGKDICGPEVRRMEDEAKLALFLLVMPLGVAAAVLALVMTGPDPSANNVLILVFPVLAVVSAVMLTGSGSWAVAGYNTMSPEEKLRYNRRKVARAGGMAMLGLAAFVGLLLCGGPWMYAGVAVMAVSILAASVYMSRCARIRIDRSVPGWNLEEGGMEGSGFGAIMGRMRAGEWLVVAANATLLLIAIVSFLVLPDIIVHHWGIGGPDAIGGKVAVFKPFLLSCAISSASICLSWLFERKGVDDSDVLRYVMLMLSLIVATVAIIGALAVLAYNIRWGSQRQGCSPASAF